jgi:hypothetical protein
MLELERRHQDPYANVVAADPSWVQLVMVDGDLAYGRADWLGDLIDPADATGRAGAGVGHADAAGYQPPRPTHQPPATTNPGRAPCRADAQYPRVGPIFA